MFWLGASGDGSAASPLGSIQAGADLAGSRGGGLVAIAAGTYVENLELGEAHRGSHWRVGAASRW
jgi:hypothetical protein